MAITLLDMSCDKVPSKCSGSIPSSKNSHKFDFPPDSSLSISTSQSIKSKRKNIRSPYLPGDRVQLFSRLTEKRFIQNTNYVSSFPLAMDLYKTNSDDFKPPKKATKKVKKSVLTLPNEPTPVPHVCTVSDMNDSEYLDKNIDLKRKVVKKRTPNRNKRKARIREKDFEFYDRDAQYCSQLNLDLDCSSIDMMKNFNGDGRRVSNKKKLLPSPNKTQAASNNLSDVWAVLRNVNRYQFRPSPPMSEGSIIPVKKKLPKKGNRKESRVIGTCHTQEFAYISSYELNKKSADASPSSSTDRITVIENHDDFSKICEALEKQLLLTHDFLRESNNSKNIIQKNIALCKSPKSRSKALAKIATKDNKQPMKMKKINNLSPKGVQQIKNVKTDFGSGKDSLISTDTLQLIDKYDTPSYITDDSMCPGKDSFIGSDTSKSSKVELSNKMNEHVSKNDIAVLNKDRESPVNTTTTLKGLDPQTRKLRLVTTMPSSCVIPKLTQTEIKRRLVSMKFPIVVLGKDQVSSSIQETDYNPPQFNGLDDHIWPFMMEWSPNIPEDIKHNTQSRTCQPYLLKSNSSSEIKSKPRKSSTEVGTCKKKAAAAAWKDKKEAINDLTANKIKVKIRPTPEITDKAIKCIKQKSIVQLKDKMLNFLYKKSSNHHVNNDSYEDDETKPLCNDNSVKAEIKVPAVIDSQLIPDKVLVRTELPEKKALLTKGRNKKTPIYKYSWAKAKWASDFIENVMKKVRSGVYYTQDRMDFRHTHHIDMKEVSVQAGSICDSTDSTQNCNSETDFILDETNEISRNNLARIPGFDNTLPLLEIKTLNMNQIAVKHCVTNSMVEFDVTIPVKSDQNITSVYKILPLTPIAITEGQTVVYKCTTTILNAMLPAELCSILPKMMSSIIDSNKSSMENSALCPIKTNSWLSTITEQTRYENGDSPSCIAIQTSPEIKEILEGRFSNIDCNKRTLNKINYKMKYDQCMVTELLSILPLVLLNYLLKYKMTPLSVELENSQYTQSRVSLHQSNRQTPDVTGIQNTTTICTTLQMCMGNNEKLTSPFKPDNLLYSMFERMMRSHNLQINQNLGTWFDMLKLQYDGKHININMSLTNDIGDEKKISVTVSNLNIDSLYKAFPKIENDKKHEIIYNRNSTPLECIEYVNTSLESKSHNTEQTQVALNKIKRKGYLKLYRKCKTTSISSEEKCTSSASIPIDKITTADDFFQILGSKKMFSSVLDDNATKKILSSVTEMKNWTSEINPKQALLILLLANKKDTQNLVRFRPMILQGIAMNRITRASELDMEIEVIDRENFNKYSQCEGITYLPETVTDYENLLDELYWIAKTTASDYNKPFNESSERLLKSLLQKRKKLNPSYLRVMARYVGLGLVKTPTEC